MTLTPIIVSVFLLGYFSVYAAETKDLEASVRATFDRSETLASQSELIRQAESRYSQAVGNVLPSIQFTASYLKQQVPQALTGRSIFPSEQPLLRFSATQPLFRGLREFAAIRQLGAMEEAQTEAERNARRLLLLDVASVHYGVLQFESDLRNIELEVELFEKRIAELKGRVAIGRSRSTEVTSVEASLSTLNAEKQGILGQREVLRETLAFFTGWPADQALSATSRIPEKLAGVDEFLKSIASRPDVRGAEHALSAAHENVWVEKGAHLPSADLVGNYYLKRKGALEDVKWDVQAVLSIPIFNGGIISARVAEANSMAMQRELDVKRTRRSAEEEIRSLHKKMTFAMLQIEELRRTSELTERNFKEMTKEYRLGLVNNLEVLQALVSFEESKRSYDRSRLSAELDYLRLEAASMRIPFLERR